MQRTAERGALWFFSVRLCFFSIDGDRESWSRVADNFFIWFVACSSCLVDNGRQTLEINSMVPTQAD
jgi:hypothetical protein